MTLFTFVLNLLFIKFFVVLRTIKYATVLFVVTTNNRNFIMEFAGYKWATEGMT